VLTGSDHSSPLRRLHVAALRRFEAIFAAKRHCTGAQASSPYEGHGWCDSSERQVTDVIVNCRRSWIV